MDQAKLGVTSTRSDDGPQFFPANGGYITVEQMRTNAIVT